MKINKTIIIILLVVGLMMFTMKKTGTAYENQCAQYNLCIDVTDDAEVRSYSPSNNYGTNYNMWVKQNDDGDLYWVYFKYNIPSGLNIEKAELNIYSYDEDGSQYVDIFQTNSGWYQNSLTWNNKPTDLSKIVADSAIIHPAYSIYDITTVVKNNLGQSFSVVLKPTRSYPVSASLKSKDATSPVGAYKSFIGIKYATTPTCTSFTYSAWSTCSGGTQTRTVISSSPTGCTGGNPILSQSCCTPMSDVLSLIGAWKSSPSSTTMQNALNKIGAYKSNPC